MTPFLKGVISHLKRYGAVIQTNGNILWPISKAVNQLIIPIYIHYFMIFFSAPPERTIAELSAILSCKD